MNVNTVRCGMLSETEDGYKRQVLDRATMEVKKEMSNKLSQIVYEGKWFTPLREAVPVSYTHL